MSRARPGTEPRRDRSTAGPCLNPSQRGTASDPGSETDLRERQQREEMLTDGGSLKYNIHSSPNNIMVSVKARS